MVEQNRDREGAVRPREGAGRYTRAVGAGRKIKTSGTETRRYSG